MNFRKIAIVLLFILLTIYCTAISHRFVARMEGIDLKTARDFERDGFDIASFNPGKYLDLVLNEEQYKKLKKLYPRIHLLVTEEDLKSNLTQKSKDIPGYHTYDDVLNLVMTLQQTYPGLLRIESIGDSWGKIYYENGQTNYENYQHDILAIMLSSNADQDEDKPAFYFMGAHHAREPISTEVCLEILTHLLLGYNTDPRITDIVNSSEIWFFPIVNPDGHKVVLDQTDIWWRKNIRDNNLNNAFDYNTYGYGLDGVDLNRNYGYEWGYTSSTDDITHPTYHGPEPFSEPETIAIRDFLQTRHFIAGITYHSYGELVLHPYGYIHDLYAPDATELSALGSLMASSIPSQDSGVYTASPSWGLYPAAGSTDDWAYGMHGIFSYTIELATQFIPPAAQVPVICQNNLEAAKLLLERKNRAMLTGHIIDAGTNQPLAATVYIPEIDDNMLDRAAYRSNLEFGTYYRFLPVGLHSL
ncbi:MAG: M14 family metallopeptidase, partial [Candidatus Cloacimonadaceae bacterium]|nr:M14 family metallopeptidase [Candidatus Cloacimonadaceae bacterium]